MEVCKSDFKFPKFHMTLHLVECIRRFGNLRVCDAGPGERMHKVIVKPAYRRTSRRTAHMEVELVRVIRTRSRLSYLVAEHNIMLRNKRRNQERALVAMEEAVDVLAGEYRVKTLNIHDHRAAPVLDMFPGNDDARREIFLYGLVANVLRKALSVDEFPNLVRDSQKVGTRAYDKLLAKYDACFKKVRLFKSLRLKPKGVKSGLIFRTCPQFRGEPWYSFLYCVVEDEEGFSRTYVGKALSFVSLQRKGENCEPEDYVLVEWYVSAVAGSGGGNDDISSRHARVHLPYVRREPVLSKRYDLMDLASISGGAWVVSDYSTEKHADPRFLVLINDAATTASSLEEQQEE